MLPSRGQSAPRKLLGQFNMFEAGGGWAGAGKQPGMMLEVGRCRAHGIFGGLGISLTEMALGEQACTLTLNLSSTNLSRNQTPLGEWG